MEVIPTDLEARGPAPVPGAGFDDSRLPPKRAWISLATGAVGSIVAGLLIWYVQSGS